jgi:hypothetical protein
MIVSAERVSRREIRCRQKAGAALASDGIAIRELLVNLFLADWIFF